MVVQAFLLALVGVFSYSSNKFFGDSMLNRPLVTASLTGLILGDFQTGLVMAGTLELTWMGIMYLGLSMPSDVTAGAIIGTAFAILSGSDVSMALTISVPAGILCAYISTGFNVVMSLAMHKADEYAAKGNLKGINAIHVGLGMAKSIGMSAVIFFAVLLGTDAVSAAVNMIPENVMNGFNVVTGILPGLGFAMLINIMWDTRFLPFYFIGFVLAVYFGANIMAVTVLAVAFAAFRLLTSKKEEEV